MPDTPRMFALDHYLYARWLTSHLYDMANLDQTNSSIKTEFDCEKFVVSKTRNSFSSMGIDHEQLHTVIKGDGGAIGLTEDPEKFHRWMLCGPETERMIKQFENVSVLKEEINSQYRHHDKTDLICMDTRDVMPDKVVLTCNQIEEIGTQNVKDFVKKD